MTHYICKGEECSSISERPGVCMSPSCINRYKLLEECNCPHRSRHLLGINIESTRIKKGASIDVINFGLAFGMLWGIGAFLLGILSIFGWGEAIVRVLSTLYIGYESTLLGSVAGGLWAFVDGFIGGALIAWFYNTIGKFR
jgi:hypothetical protein